MVVSRHQHYLFSLNTIFTNTFLQVPFQSDWHIDSWFAQQELCVVELLRSQIELLVTAELYYNTMMNNNEKEPWWVLPFELQNRLE